MDRRKDGAPPRPCRYHARSEEDTARFTAQLVALAEPGAVLTLDGDPGAGKTRFAQAFARGLRVTEIVNSLTFEKAVFEMVVA
jgi:tRNA threonylcarbamoyladenosine biosynthesis protein TsaE